MDVSIIIVNYNTKDITKGCVESVYEKTKDITFEVIIVDNASTDGSKDLFEKDPRITYIYNTLNKGFGAANNDGIKVAKGRNILFLNSDTILVNNAIKILSDFLDHNIEAAGCGANMLDRNMNPTHSFGRFFPSIFWEINMLFHNIPERIIYGKHTNYNYSNRILKVAHIVGADLMVKKSVIDQIGGFDLCFFMYREETELCFRIIKKGYKLYSIPYAKIIHLEGQSLKCSTEINIKKIQWIQNSTYLFLNMYHGKIYVNIVRAIQYISVCTHIIMCALFNHEHLNYWKAYKKCLK